MKNKIVRNIVYGIIIFIFMAIQSSNILAFFDINPDFLLIIIILHSLNYGEYYVTLVFAETRGELQRLSDVIKLQINPVDLFGTGKLPTPFQSLIATPSDWSYLMPSENLWVQGSS